MVKTLKKSPSPKPAKRERGKQLTMWITLGERNKLKKRSKLRGFKHVSDYIRKRLGLKVAPATTVTEG